MMISDDSGHGLFADKSSKPHRRSGEQRLEALANNALLKVLQFALTGVALPAIVFGINTMINRMDSLEAKLIAQDKADATKELRLIQAEKQVADVSSSTLALRDRVLVLELQSRMQPNAKGNP
jgi:hypothetical protein